MRLSPAFTRAAVLLDVGFALGGTVSERRDRVLEPDPCIVERIVAARRELVLEGVETRKEEPSPVPLSRLPRGRIVRATSPT
jgi:hypothetical protein